MPYSCAWVMRASGRAMAFHFVHQVAEHAALPAAGGDDAVRRALLDAFDAGAGLHGGGITSQSTVTDSTSPRLSTSRWLRR